MKAGVVGAVSGAAALLMVTVAPAASARVLDTVQQQCGSALVTAKVEQDGRDREFDIEVYSSARGEKWRIAVRDGAGNVLHRINRTTNRDGEFSVWRYVPATVDQFAVRVNGPAGQSCSLGLSTA